MKNTTYVPYEKNVKITEHKAVTDESIRILNEFQEKARENLCYSVKINQTYLNGIALFFQADQITGGFEVYYKFSLNGSEFKVKTEISEEEWGKERMNNELGAPATRIALKLIHGKISEEIAKELLMSNISTLNSYLKHK